MRADRDINNFSVEWDYEVRAFAGVLLARTRFISIACVVAAWWIGADSLHNRVHVAGYHIGTNQRRWLHCFDSYEDGEYDADRIYEEVDRVAKNPPPLPGEDDLRIEITHEIGHVDPSLIARISSKV